MLESRWAECGSTEILGPDRARVELPLPPGNCEGKAIGKIEPWGPAELGQACRIACQQLGIAGRRWTRTKIDERLTLKPTGNLHDDVANRNGPARRDVHRTRSLGCQQRNERISDVLDEQEVST